jgi:hypothetical protein
VSLRGTLQAKSGLYIYLSKKYMVKLDKTEWCFIIWEEQNFSSPDV